MRIDSSWISSHWKRIWNCSIPTPSMPDAPRPAVLLGFETNGRRGLERREDDGSIALIPSKQIEAANYCYASSSEIVPVLLGYFTDIDTASAILEHARAIGKLTPSGAGSTSDFYGFRHRAGEACRLHGLNPTECP